MRDRLLPLNRDQPLPIAHRPAGIWGRARPRIVPEVRSIRASHYIRAHRIATILVGLSANRKLAQLHATTFRQMVKYRDSTHNARVSRSLRESSAIQIQASRTVLRWGRLLTDSSPVGYLFLQAESAGTTRLVRARLASSVGNQAAAASTGRSAPGTSSSLPDFTS